MSTIRLLVKGKYGGNMMRDVKSRKLKHKFWGNKPKKEEVEEIIDGLKSDIDSFDYFRQVHPNLEGTMLRSRKAPPANFKNKAKADGCALCGSMLKVNIDHRIPITMNGADNAQNWRPLCSDCHEEKNRFERKWIFLFRLITFLFLRNLIVWEHSRKSLKSIQDEAV